MRRQRLETKDGYELVMGTVHLGQWYLTELLMDRGLFCQPSGIARGATFPRLINVCSVTNRFGSFSSADDLDLNMIRNPGTSLFKQYAKAYLAQLAYSKRLSRSVGETMAVMHVFPGEFG